MDTAPSFKRTIEEFLIHLCFKKRKYTLEEKTPLHFLLGYFLSQKDSLPYTRSQRTRTRLKPLCTAPVEQKAHKVNTQTTWFGEGTGDMNSWAGNIYITLFSSCSQLVCHKQLSLVNRSSKATLILTGSQTSTRMKEQESSIKLSFTHLRA